MSRRALLASLPALLAGPIRGQDGAGDPPQWVLVTAPAFRAALEPLSQHRRAEGMRVVVVETTEVLSPAQIRGGDAGPLREHLHKLCRQSRGPTHVLLVGAAKAAGPETAERTVVPALRGTAGRMRGRLTDNGYGCLDQGLRPAVAVGRFPARTADEARGMVEKTLAFERDRSGGPWQKRLTLLAGNPGGTSLVEKRFAEWFVQGVAWTRFGRLHPYWTGRVVIHARGSPFCVPDDRLREVSLGYLQEGQVFAFYLGHSSAAGLWSGDARFLDREDWARLKMPGGRGVLFTCGCYGCQWDDEGGEGYALAAMRNPTGPAAVMGAHGESYGAMGQLAVDGLLERLGAAQPPARLADGWLAVKDGLARGKIDGFSFWLYDQADGSRGQVPLEAQRLEHLEMWTLLGDPALRLPARPPPIEFEPADTALPGKTVTVRGSIPARLADAAVRLTLERPTGSTPLGLEPLPADPARLAEVMWANHQRANEVVLARREVEARQGRFECVLELPAELPWPRLTVRAAAGTGDEAALGVLSLNVGK